MKNKNTKKIETPTIKDSNKLDNRSIVLANQTSPIGYTIYIKLNNGHTIGIPPFAVLHHYKYSDVDVYNLPKGIYWAFNS